MSAFDQALPPDDPGKAYPRLSIMMTDAEYERIKKMCSLGGVHVNRLVRAIIHDWMDKHQF